MTDAAVDPIQTEQIAVPVETPAPIDAVVEEVSAPATDTAPVASVEARPEPEAAVPVAAVVDVASEPEAAVVEVASEPEAAVPVAQSEPEAQAEHEAAEPEAASEAQAAVVDVASEPEAAQSEPAPAAVEVASEPAAATPTGPQNLALVYANGDIVPGLVTRVIGDGIDVDLGQDRIGVIPRSEVVGDDPAVGDSIEGTVIRRQGGTGRYVLSPKRASRERLWGTLIEKMHSGEIVNGKVTGVTKGGLVVDVGVRAFLPDSLTDTRKSFPSSTLVGQDVQVKIVEAEKGRERLVVNRKAVVDVERKEKRGQLLSEIQPGQRFRGRVTTLLPFGCFVDIGGAEGLVHVSELAHRNVAKVEDEVRAGEEIDVVVISVDQAKGKIGLSRKAAMANPWDSFISEHKVGDLVYGTVSGLAPFGAFVTLDGENFGRLEGLVHISELSRFRVETPADVVSEGEGVWVKVLSIDGEKRRLSLSLRRALDGD